MSSAHTRPVSRYWYSALHEASTGKQQQKPGFSLLPYCFEYTGVTLDDVRNHRAALRGVLHTVSEQMNSLGDLWDDMYNSAKRLLLIGVVIVGAVICFSEKIGYRHPVRVLQRARGPLLPLLPPPPPPPPLHHQSLTRGCLCAHVPLPPWRAASPLPLEPHPHEVRNSWLKA
jgi:hypothetical protein